MYLYTSNPTRNTVTPLLKCEIINRVILSWLLFGHHDVLNSPHKLRDNGLISALLHTLDYTPFIVLFFNGNLTLHVVVTAIGPYTGILFCWGPLNIDLLYHPIVCPDNSLPASAMHLPGFFQLESFHAVKVNQSPSRNTVAGSIQGCNWLPSRY